VGESALLLQASIAVAGEDHGAFLVEHAPQGEEPAVLPGKLGKWLARVTTIDHAY